jgi:hypothetical protein
MIVKRQYLLIFFLFIVSQCLHASIGLVGSSKQILFIGHEEGKISIRPCKSYRIPTNSKKCKEVQDSFKLTFELAEFVSIHKSLIMAIPFRNSSWEKKRKVLLRKNDYIKILKDKQILVEENEKINKFLDTFGEDEESLGKVVENNKKIKKFENELMFFKDLDKYDLEFKEVFNITMSYILNNKDIKVLNYKNNKDDIHFIVLESLFNYPALWLSQFKLIPAGKFKMGSSETESNRDDDEKLHSVRIEDSFQLMTTEVTQLSWVILMNENPKRNIVKADCPNDFQIYKSIGLCATHPVSGVSWDSIKKFIAKLNQQTPFFNYRLPTEAEWEYAARAGSSKRFSFGNKKDNFKIYAWAENNSYSSQKVGSKESNSFGLHDMHGNVWEWTSDNYNSDYSNKSSTIKVAKGGSYCSSVNELRSANRKATYSSRSSISCSNDIGFRLVRD